MKATFADTFYFLALLNPRDSDHARALTASNALERQLADGLLFRQGDATAYNVAGTLVTVLKESHHEPQLTFTSRPVRRFCARPGRRFQPGGRKGGGLDQTL